MFNDKQTKSLQQDLDKKHVKKRSGGGKQLSYVEAWHAIAEANRIFGHDGWDRELKTLHLISEHERSDGKGGFMAHYLATVRVTVHSPEGLGIKIIRDGTGYGNSYGKNPGEAHEVAAKEAESDAMKRALMTFGNPFGLALYDKAQSNVSGNVEVITAVSTPESTETLQEPVQGATEDLVVETNLVRMSTIKEFLSSDENSWSATLDSYAIMDPDRYWEAGEEDYFEFLKKVGKQKELLADDDWYQQLALDFGFKKRTDAQGKPRAMTLFYLMLAYEVLDRSKGLC